jgi:hypothetical protein
VDALIPFALAALALFGAIAAIAGVESRDGFDRDGWRDEIDTRGR